MRDFVTHAALELGIVIGWQGRGEDEHGVVTSAPADSAVKQGQRITAVDPRYFRPTEVETLLGDASKARSSLGWAPKIAFDELVSEMMAADLKLAQRDTYLRQGGFLAANNHE